MLLNNFKIAYRQLVRQKLFSFVKIGGFGLGIAACLLIGLYIYTAFSYDQHYVQKDRIYRLVRNNQLDDQSLRTVWFPAPAAEALLSSFPEIEKVARIRPGNAFDAGSNQIRSTEQQKNSFEDGFVYADPALLDILEVEMIYGNPERALREPQSIVLSKSKSDKYFPNEDPVGKSVILNDDVSKIFKVGGVMADFPSNSHFQFDFLMSLEGKEFWPGEATTWLANNYHTYLRLHEDIDPKRLEAKLMSLIDDYYIPSRLDAGLTDAEESSRRLSFNLQAITDIHLGSEDLVDLAANGDIRLIRLFSAIAFFILLLASINFINLSTAKSANRAKEVGLRKVVGSLKHHLIGQFLTESVLLSLFALVVGVWLAESLLPFFNQMAGKTMVFPWQEWWLLPFLIICATFIGILAGLYPAFYLCTFQPAKVLKGSVSRGSKNSSLRNILVVFQFSTSIVLIISTLVVYQQLDFILNTKLGYDKEQLLVLKGTQVLGDNIQTLKEELLSRADVQAATVSEYLPISGTMRNDNGFRGKDEKGQDQIVSGQIWRIDHDYLATLGMELIQGRVFSPRMATDSQAIIINETMASRFGFTNPIGKEIVNGDGQWNIIGVVKDFHFESLKEEIGGLCLVLGNSPAAISIKVNTDDIGSFIPSLKGLWDNFAPNQPFQYDFLDERYAAMYADVQRTRSIFGSFALLAIVIACLGIFALSVFMTEQRGKEISIRKILGASVQNILRLLTQNFLILITISIAIASPVAAYFMQKWLEDFTYHISISWSIFALAGLATLLLALLTIGVQAWQTAHSNPAKFIQEN